MSDQSDPVLVRRAQMAKVASLGMKFGYLCLGVACVAFVVAVTSSLPDWAVTLTVVGLVGAAIALPPAIVIDYGVKKATREEP